MPNIRVAIRFRPLNSREKAINDELEEPMEMEQMAPFDIGEYGYNLSTWTQWPRTKKYKHDFTYDQILWNKDQVQAFEKIALPLAQDFVTGINGTIFAYGQSGSGKSFTMFGKEPEMWEVNKKGKRVRIPTERIRSPPPELQGLIPRTCSYTFSWIKKNSDKLKSFSCQVSFYEIYIRGTVRDLLDGGAHLAIRDFKEGVTLVRKDRAQKFKSKDPKERAKALITKVPVKNLEEMMKRFVQAQEYRTVKATKLNPHSSRGHCIMKLWLTIQKKNGEKYSSVFNFADLAGSEKVSKSEATGDLLEEAKYINQSLTTLGQVINALARTVKKGPRPPFRDSALSHCLKDSLIGNTRTAVVIAASPHCDNVFETLSSLKFGKRCKNIKTKIRRNIQRSAKEMMALIAKQKDEISRLKKLLGKGAGGSMKPYGPAIIFKTGSPTMSDDDEIKFFKEEAKKFFWNFSKEVDVDPEEYTLKFHVSGEDTLEVGIYVEKKDGDDLRELIDYRDRIYKHCRRLIANPSSPFKGEFTREDPFDADLLNHYKAEVIKLNDENKTLENELHTHEQELQRQEERVEELSKEIHKLKAPQVRSSVLNRIDDLTLVTDTQSQIDESIENFILHVEDVVSKNSQDAASIAARKAIGMLKQLRFKMDEMYDENKDLHGSVDTLKERYDQISNDKQLYQAQLLESKSLSHLHLDIDEKRKPKDVNTARMWCKLAKKGDEISFKQLVMETAAQNEYLNKATEKYFDKKPNRRGLTMLMDQMFEGDEDLSSVSVRDMTPRNVMEWVGRTNDKMFQSFVNDFDGISGTDLLRMDTSDLKEIGMDLNQIEVFLDAVRSLTLMDPEEEVSELERDDSVAFVDGLSIGESFTQKNIYEQYLSEFHAPEVAFLQQLRDFDPNERFDNNDYVSFVQMSQSLEDIIGDKSILVKIFSLIDTRQSGIISTTKLIKFLETIRSYKIENRVFTDVSPYTDYLTILKGHSHRARLTREGARMIVAELRGCDKELIRESDVAIEYLCDLNRHQLRSFLESCPEAAWNTLSRFHIFEKLINNIQKLVKENPEDEAGTCTMATFLKSFHMEGINEITEEIIRSSLDTISIDYLAPFNYMLAFNVLGDPLSDCPEIQEIMGDRTTIQIEQSKNRIPAPAVWLQTRQEREEALQAESKMKLLHKGVRALVKENSKNKVKDNLSRVKRDYENQLLNSAIKEKEFLDQESMLKSAYDDLEAKKHSEVEMLKQQLEEMRRSAHEEKKRFATLERSRAEKSKMFHAKELELQNASKELDAMKEIYEKDMQVSADERARRQREIMDANRALEVERLAMNQKEEELQRAMADQTLLQKHKAELMDKYNRELSKQSEHARELEKEQKIRNAMVAQADYELAKRIKKEWDDQIRTTRRKQMRKDEEYASHMRKSARKNRRGASSNRHARGVSNAEYTHGGTVRKKEASTLKIHDEVRTTEGMKGIVKYQGEVKGLGYVIGLDIFVGRGNHDGRYNGRKYFATKKNRGKFVHQADISHVYRTNSSGVKQKIRFKPRGGEGGGEGGHRALQGIGEDEMFMNNATSGLGGIQVAPSSAQQDDFRHKFKKNLQVGKPGNRKISEDASIDMADFEVDQKFGPPPATDEVRL